MVQRRLPLPGQLSCKINSARAALTLMSCAAPLSVQVAPHWCSREMAENSQNPGRESAYGVLVNCAHSSCFQRLRRSLNRHKKTVFW